MPTIIITGASQGIGTAIALRFAREQNVTLALVARNEANLKTVADQCRSLGAKASVVVCDVADHHAVAHAMQSLVETLGVPDLLINNAGTFLPGSILETSPEEFKRQVDVNLNSAFYVTRSILPAMLERKSGAVYFMASVASIRAYPNGGGYCASKHGLLGLSRVVREETRNDGIKTVAFLPGATRTASWDGTDLPDERFMAPEDIAELVWSTFSLSPRTMVEEVVMRPQLGDI